MICESYHRFVLAQRDKVVRLADDLGDAGTAAALTTSTISAGNAIILSSIGVKKLTVTRSIDGDEPGGAISRYGVLIGMATSLQGGGP